MVDRPKVGVGVIIQNKQGQILVGKRSGSHAPYWSIPGGHLENGETFEQAAVKEVKEETNLDIEQPVVFAVSNNLDTWHEEGKHYISVALVCHSYTGQVKNREPDKCEEWRWVSPSQLPEPHFEASLQSVACFLDGKFYLGNNG